MGLFNGDPLCVSVCRFDLVMCLSVWLACTCVHHVCTWCPWRSEEASGPVELELWRVMWVQELKLGPLQEQQVLLTAGLSPQGFTFVESSCTEHEFASLARLAG